MIAQVRARLMRRLLWLAASAAAALGAFLALGGCTAIAQRCAATPQPLAYVGEVTLGPPTVADRQVRVPLSFRGGQWGANSAIVPYRAPAAVSGREISFTVITSVPGDGAAAAPALVLPGLAPGEYAVVYRDPDGTRHALGRLTVPATAR